MAYFVTDVEAFAAQAAEADATLQMDEETFRAVYDRTARPLWNYLRRVTGDAHLADDLLQETYYRFLRARATYDNDAHRRNSLFRIATNLVHDTRRRARVRPLPALGDADVSRLTDRTDVAAEADRRADLERALQQMKPRERALLWLAYAEGSSHREIAAAVGVQISSVKLLLFRARKKLAGILSCQL
jgi:RNA polymerase sigma-70 factor (ECF subfamily)